MADKKPQKKTTTKKVDENAQVKKQVKKATKKAAKKALKNKNVQIALIVLVVVIIVALVVVYFVKPEIFDALLGNTSEAGHTNKNKGTNHVIDGASVVITFVDVGQGDGIYIEFPTGENMFVDGGTEKGKGDFFENIADVFEANNVTKLDYYFISHTDYDHIKYIPQVCAAVEVERFLIPYISDEISSSNDSNIRRSEAWTAAYTAIKSETYVENGETKQASITYNLGTFDLGGDSWVMHCYTYDQADYPVQNKNTSVENFNCISPVCFLQYGGRTTCLTGDQNFKGEKYLSEKGYFDSYDIDVLKVAHHGSKEGTHQNYFLNKVDPEYAVISVGAENGYNHPHTELLTRLDEYTDVTPDDDANGIQQVFKTSEDGNVIVTMSSDGKISITSTKHSEKNVVAVACVMYAEDNNIEIVYVAYVKKEGEE